MDQPIGVRPRGLQHADSSVLSGLVSGPDAYGVHVIVVTAINEMPQAPGNPETRRDGEPRWTVGLTTPATHWLRTVRYHSPNMPASRNSVRRCQWPRRSPRRHLSRTAIARMLRNDAKNDQTARQSVSTFIMQRDKLTASYMAAWTSIGGHGSKAESTLGTIVWPQTLPECLYASNIRTWSGYQPSSECSESVKNLRCRLSKTHVTAPCAASWTGAGSLESTIADRPEPLEPPELDDEAGGPIAAAPPATRPICLHAGAAGTWSTGGGRIWLHQWLSAR